jgi:NADP-dependent aldehyde dehydrogenase
VSELQGFSLLGFGRATRSERTFAAHDPAAGEILPPAFHAAVPEDVERACRLADEAFQVFGHAAPAERAALLRVVASGLEERGPAIVARAQRETALPVARLQSELGRTCLQLRLFADVAAEGSWVDARIDTGDPDRKPLPRPDVRSMRIPLGPVVVFGASNFPLAFSVAGGDTASALAAGNPVIVKAHPLHPGTSELVGQAIVDAIRHAGLPEGTFSLLLDDGFAVAEALVRHPVVQAVGFTGSRAGGEALALLAARRARPIPVFAEMGSVNPVFILPGAARARGGAIAEGLHASFTLGVGQFCTNPGIVFLEAGPEGDAVVARLVELTRATPAAPMLSARTCASYGEGLARLHGLGATSLAEGLKGDGDAAGRATLWQVGADAVLGEPRLGEEVFGPSTLIVRYSGLQELLRLAASLDGQLTASVHGASEERESAGPLLRLLARKAGRLVFDQFPTGVEVNQAMVHGGPAPATSDGRSTSVGTRAIERWSRLVAFQNAAQDVLPRELQDGNPLGISRLVDGVRRSDPLK